MCSTLIGGCYATALHPKVAARLAARTRLALARGAGTPKKARAEIGSSRKYAIAKRTLRKIILAELLGPRCSGKVLGDGLPQRGIGAQYVAEACEAGSLIKPQRAASLRIVRIVGGRSMVEGREAVPNLPEQPDWAPVDAAATLAADKKVYDAIKANEREQGRWRVARYS